MLECPSSPKLISYFKLVPNLANHTFFETQFKKRQNIAITFKAYPLLKKTDPLSYPLWSIHTIQELEKNKAIMLS